MNSKQNVSLLFRTAALHSEKIRILGLIAALVFLAAFTSVRAVLSESLHGLFAKTLPLLLGAVGYEVILWFLAKRAERQKKYLPGWLVVLTIILETSFPTLALFIMTTEPELNPFSVLSAPVVSVYFLLLIISALRLNPGLCIVSGIVACGGYGAVTAYVYSHWQPPPHQNMISGVSAQVTYGVLLLLGGVMASVVARKIRTEVSQGILQIEKRQRLEADLEVARSIQIGLLPKEKPQLPQFDVAGQSWPADQTGGDYYDWLPLPDGRWVVTIADVTGHGIGPALLTANCHAYVHALFGTSGDLHSWISRINGFLADDLEMGRFITFLAVVLNPSDASFSVLSAGHGPTLLYRSSSGLVEELPTQGPPLGIVADYQYMTPIELKLETGDFLVLLTDGFTEWADPLMEQFGVDRAKSALQKQSTLSSAQIIEALRADVLSFAGGTSQKDDLTAVVIKR
jgi:hypothetical protein